MIARAALVPPYFALRVGCALVLLKLATICLPPAGFNLFAQFGLFAALVNFVCAGALQNGLVGAVAAAGGDEAALGRAHAAAMWLAGGCCMLVALMALLDASPLSAVLAGDRSHGGAVVALVAVSLLGVPGLLWCALLTGEGRVHASLTTQGCGLAVGTVLAAWRLTRSDPAGAAICLAGGGVATTTLALIALRPWRLGRPLGRPRMSDVRTLAGFAVTVGTSFALSSVALFGLRYIVREQQGVTALSYWLAANRVSDLSTQLIGLMMAQVVLPALTRETPANRRAILLQGIAFGAAVSGGALFVFLLAAKPLVTTFLSPTYLAAIPAITLYLCGDVLRSIVPLRQQLNLAGGRLGRYAALELGSPAIMTPAIALLLARGEALAPEIAYCLANTVLAAISARALLGYRRDYRLARSSAETV